MAEKVYAAVVVRCVSLIAAQIETLEGVLLASFFGKNAMRDATLAAKAMARGVNIPASEPDDERYCVVVTDGTGLPTFVSHPATKADAKILQQTQGGKIVSVLDARKYKEKMAGGRVVRTPTGTRRR